MWSESVHWMCAGSMTSWEVQAKISHCLYLPEAIQHELQSDLLMATNCAGLGGVQERPSYEPKLAVAIARVRAP